MSQRVHAFERSLTPEVMLRVYAIVGDHYSILVDTAMVGFEDMVSEALAAISASGKPLRLVVNTHAHHDHIGLNRWVQSQTNALIASHKWGSRWISDPDVNYREFVLSNPHIIPDSPDFRRDVRQTLGPGVSLDIGLVGGEVLDPGGVPTDVVDLSGHMPGEVGLLVRGEKTLLIGDALTCRTLPFFHGHLRPALYRETLNRIDRLVDMGVIDRVLSIHLPPIDGPEAIRAELTVRRRDLDRLDADIERQLSQGSRTLAEVWQAVSQRWNKQPEFRGLSMVQAHLSDLCAQGRVEQLGELFHLT